MQIMIGAALLLVSEDSCARYNTIEVACTTDMIEEEFAGYFYILKPIAPIYPMSGVILRV